MSHSELSSSPSKTTKSDLTYRGVTFKLKNSFLLPELRIHALVPPAAHFSSLNQCTLHVSMLVGLKRSMFNDVQMRGITWTVTRQIRLISLRSVMIMITVC
jgi:hypothetical protein